MRALKQMSDISYLFGDRKGIGLQKTSFSIPTGTQTSLRPFHKVLLPKFYVKSGGYLHQLYEHRAIFIGIYHMFSNGCQGQMLHLLSGRKVDSGTLGYALFKKYSGIYQDSVLSLDFI